MDYEPDTVQYKPSAEGITTIALNRGPRRNAVNRPTAKRLRDSFLAFENDDSQKICVFHGENGTFCAGYDLQALAKSAQDSDSISDTPADPVHGANLAPMGPSRMVIKKPVICAVSGYAVAGGLELSLLGDMRVVEEDAVFGVFCRRFGVPLIDGGTVRLQKVVGFGRAMDMILTGRPVGAAEALNMGLANRVVPTGKAIEEATSLARMLLKFPQKCMNADRISCYNAAYEASSLEEALSFEYNNGLEVIAAESIQGAANFSKGTGRHGSL